MTGKTFFLLCLSVSLYLCLPSSVAAYQLPQDLTQYEIKSWKIHDATESVGNPHLNNVYFVKSVSFKYKKGFFYISSTPDGTGPINFDHALAIYATYPSSGSFLLEPGCGSNELPPLKISQFINPSSTQNTHIFFSYRRGYCNQWKSYDGVYKSYANVGNLYLVYYEEKTEAPKPFLRLPWDYEAAGMNFYEASTKINSYFDHEYPLLSSWNVGDEPAEAQNNMVLYYESNRNTQESYSTHDGYDWGGNAGAYNGTPQLAAAAGTATYVSSCGACGNAIHIDHHNGYQTRYYHLQSEGLVTTSTAEVEQGQQIGLIGSTGNSDGPHIHFMVIHDKNGDGNFNDNIPDGLVDPYGWQPFELDPWEHYTFTQNGVEKKGSKSYYLWENLPIKTIRAIDNESQFNLNLYKYRIEIPKNSTDGYRIFEAQLNQKEQQGKLASLDNTINIKVHDGYGNIVTKFQRIWNLIINFSPEKTARFDKDTLAMYSRNEGDTEWKKEATTIDFEKNTAKISINHMTSFALMGELLDSKPPTTTATLSGVLADSQQISTLEAELFSNPTEATASAPLFTSPVKISLTAHDTPVEHSLGIKYTLYKINEEIWLEYDGEVNFPEEGSYLISFYSLDGDKNEEEYRYIGFEIDFEPPTPTPDPTEVPFASEGAKLEPTAQQTNTPTPTTSSYKTPTPTDTAIPSPSTENTNVLSTPNSIASLVDTQNIVISPRPTSLLDDLDDDNDGISESSVLGVSDRSENKNKAHGWNWLWSAGVSMLTATGAWMWKIKNKIPS